MYFPMITNMGNADRNWNVYDGLFRKHIGYGPICRAPLYIRWEVTQFLQ